MPSPIAQPLPDHANEADHRALAIDRVGIKDLSYPIQVLDKLNNVQHTVARVNLYVGLPQHFKGTHMSRFVALLNARRGEMTIRNMPQILTEIQDRLEADDAHIELEFPYFLSKKAPVSGVESLLEYRCRFLASKRKDEVDFILGVQVPVKSLCPCSKAVSKYGAHNQRSLVDVQIRSSEFIWIEDAIAAVEANASAPLFALLKREDEKYITELAYDNPKFVEDLVRDVVIALRALPGVHWLHVSAENLESIHNHSAYGEIEWNADDTGVATAAKSDDSNAPTQAAETLPFGRWLKEQRLGRSYSQQAFAGHLGISAAHLSRVESGDKRLSTDALRRSANLLGRDAELMEIRGGALPEHLQAIVSANPQAFRDWARTLVN